MTRPDRLTPLAALSISLLLPALTGQEGCPPPAPTVIADSESEFSSIQGGGNWFYGYVAPATGEGFVQMHIYTNHASWGPIWLVDAEKYWTMMGSRNVMPNAVNTTGEHKAVEHWPVRRWVSEVSGEITLTGTVARLTEESYSDGATVRIEVAGIPVWESFIAPGDTVGLTYDVTTTVEKGVAVDFILEPGRNDWEDDTAFTATILH